MSLPFDSTLVVALKPSPALTIASAVLHAGALVIVVASSGDLWWRVSLAALVGLSSILGALRHGGHRWAGRWYGATAAAIAWSSGGEWTVRLAHQTDWQVYTLQEYWCGPWLVIVRLKPLAPGRCLSVVIPWDAAAPEPFRRLRARLRLQNVAA